LRIVSELLIDSTVHQMRAGFLLVVSVVFMVLALPAAAQSEADDLSAGGFLVASRDLLDPNFHQTVVLLLDYSEEGALGVIINRPTQVELDQMMSDLESAWEGAGTVWVGGPVAHWQMVLLIRSTAALEGAERVFEDVHFTASRLVLEQMLQSETEFRTYAGYAGWGAGQLEGEIERGSWHVLPGDSDMVFDEAPLELWRELINRGEAQWASLR